MTIEALNAALPAYARDLRQNLTCLAEETVLPDQRKWGCFVAAAHAGGEPAVMARVESAARAAGMSDTALEAAKAAAAVTSMNNVYFRSLQLMSNAEYRTMPSKLRMNVIANPGVEKDDFELWCLVVSAINGCGMCLDSHEAELKHHRTPCSHIQGALRIAAVVSAVSRVLGAEEKVAA